MKSKEPLTQSEIKDMTEQKHWTNLARVLKELVDEGLVNKKRIGMKDYFVKVEGHKFSTKLEVGEFCYFIDLFEPDKEGQEKYYRIKQTRILDRDSYETLGKITVNKDLIEELCSKMKQIKK